jgi:hypothetical protein
MLKDKETEMKSWSALSVISPKYNYKGSSKRKMRSSKRKRRKTNVIGSHEPRKESPEDGKRANPGNV